MCLIVDTNEWGDLVSRQDTSRFRPLLSWLDGPGCLVIGGTRYSEELQRHREATRFVIERLRAGRARQVDNRAVDHRAVALRGSCQSDDEHIVALAIVSGARVVCTEDRALIVDLRNRALIDRPRCSVYKRAAHRKVLRHTRACGHAPVRRGAPGRRRRTRR